jgi:hypothetical protein
MGRHKMHLEELRRESVNGIKSHQDILIISQDPANRVMELYAPY